MPDILGIEPIFNTLYNLAMGYVASVIFYILQVYIPDERKSRECLDIIRPDIQKLCDEMAYIIELFNCFTDIKDDKVFFKEIYNEFCYYKVEKYEDENIQKLNDFKVIRNEFKKYSEKQNRIIESIKSKTLYQNCDDKLIGLITALEYNKFPQTLNEVGKLSGIIDIGFLNIEEYLKEFKTLKNEIEKFNLKKINYKFESMNEAEREEYKKTIEKSKLQTQLISELINR